MTAPLGPRDRYRLALDSGALRPDPGQAAALDALHGLFDALITASPPPPPSPGAGAGGGWSWRRAAGGLLGRAGHRGQTGGASPCDGPSGLYLHGPVGRGKSMLMDLFAASLPEGWGRRLHFHAFMREAHALLHRWRNEEAAEQAARGRRPRATPPPSIRRARTHDPMPRLARALADGHRVLCLDELDIQDIGDAMIVARLFDSLLALGVVVVMTSNRPPEDLYADGLQREKLLPFIALLRQRLTVLAVDGARDFRRDRLLGEPVYHIGTGEEADAWLSARLDALAEAEGGATPAPDVVMVHGRRVPVRAATRRLGRFAFDDLCHRPLGSHDYLAIAERFEVVLLSDIPSLGPKNADAARRFVVLIDTLYDMGRVLVCTAAAAPEALYRSGRGTFEFERTVSRLLEMQSRPYLERAPRATPPQGE